MRGAFALLALLQAGLAAAQPSAPVPQEGHARLAPLVGKWTVRGMEDRFQETCEWFEGRFHIVCRSETRRSDGTVGRGLSILGYVAAEDAYTYHGIGSRGRNVTLRGRSRDGMIEFTAPASATSAATRVRLGPFAGPLEFAFVEEEQSADGSWRARSESRYVRID